MTTNNMRSKIKMAVIRGTDARPAQTYFYNYFTKMAIKFIGHSIKASFFPPVKRAKMELVETPLVPVWGIDPARLIYGKTEHHSWDYHQNLEKHISDCDILNVSDCFFLYCRQAALLAKKYHKPLVAIVWQTYPKHPSTYIPPYSWGVGCVRQQTDLFIARSKMAKKYLISIGVPDRKIEVIYKGVDLNCFFPVKKKNWRGVRILYVGQLHKYKGVDLLLYAFEKLHQDNPNIELWFSGRGPLKKMITDFTKRLPIKLFDFVEYSELSQIYRQCDIFCSPSISFKYFGIFKGGEDWFSYTLMEAMASGLPIVSTYCGGIPEEVGKDNLLVKQNSSEGLYKALKKLVDDQSLREKIAKRNRIRAEKYFSAKKQAAETEAAILKLVS